jgi:hypothetical protein
MNPYAIQANDVIAYQNEQGDNCPMITWNEKQYPILPNSVENFTPLRPGGFSFFYDGKFLIVVSQWLSPTITNATQLAAALANTFFTYNDGKYKFKGLRILSGATMIECSANALNQNA